MDVILKAMDGSVGSVDEGRGVVESLCSELEQIAEVSHGAAGQMATIAGTLTQQSARTEEISDTAVSVSRISSNSTEEIEQVIGAMDSLSESLNKQVGLFADLGPVALVEIARNDHTLFKKTVIDALIGRRAIKPEALADEHNCRLGKWWKSADEDIRRHPSFARLADPHRRVHEGGKRVLMLVQEGRLDEATDALQPMNQASHEVLDLLGQLTKEMATAPGLAASAA